MPKYEAVIFDLDGVIVSTDEHHYRAWKRLADEMGIRFDRGINERLRGVSRMESLDIILEQYHGPPLTIEEKNELAARKNECYRAGLQSMTPADLPAEVKQTTEALRARGVKMAIGSSSKNTPLILGRVGLAGYFDAVSDGNDIQNSKPHPEVFLLAAERLGVPPKKCLVVEDAVAGAEAARAGGMDCACVGYAAKLGCGKYNLNSVGQLIDIF